MEFSIYSINKTGTKNKPEPETNKSDQQINTYLCVESTFPINLSGEALGSVAS